MFLQTLYTYANNNKAAKAIITSQYCNIKLNIPPFKMGEENKTEEYLKKNPNSTVPTLETSSGCIYGSNSIAKYIARMRPDVGLCGETFHDEGLVDQWCEWSNTQLEPPAEDWYLSLVGCVKYNKEREASSKQKLEGLLKIMDDHLMDKEYFVGNKITLADIVLFCAIVHHFQYLFDEDYRKKFPSLTKWFVNLSNEEEFINVFGKIELCSKPIVYENPQKQ